MGWLILYVVGLISTPMVVTALGNTKIVGVVVDAVACWCWCWCCCCCCCLLLLLADYCACRRNRTVVVVVVVMVVDVTRWRIITYVGYYCTDKAIDSERISHILPNNNIEIGMVDCMILIFHFND